MISELAAQIDDLLPQTQCTKCGFDGCAPYARAIADGTALYNQCPPGGQEGVARLARLLQRPELPLNPANGIERPRPRAVIDESVCIGCTLCIQACPVDAIVGAAKQMHTVIEADCTGCDLCVAPCPVDCIEMVPVTGDATGWDAWSAQQANDARAHYQQRLARLAAERQAAEQRAALRIAEHAAEQAAQARRAAAEDAEVGMDAEAEAQQARKQAIIQAAIERARLRQQATAPATHDASAPPDTASAASSTSATPVDSAAPAPRLKRP